MANFWESLLDSGRQRPDDPGDPSLPYGAPLWPGPKQSSIDMRNSDLPRFELRFGEPAQQVPLWPQRQMPTLGEVIRKYDPPQSDPWFGQQPLEPDPQERYPSLPYEGQPAPKEPPWPQQQRSEDPFDRAAYRTLQAVHPDGGRGRYGSTPPEPPEGRWPWPGKRPAELRSWDAPPYEDFHSSLYDHYRGRGASHIEAINKADYLAPRLSYLPPFSWGLAVADMNYARKHGDPLGVATAATGLIPWTYIAGKARPAFKMMMDRTP